MADRDLEHGLDPLAVVLGVQIEHLGDGAPARYRNRFEALRDVQSKEAIQVARVNIPSKILS